MNAAFGLRASGLAAVLAIVAAAQAPIEPERIEEARQAFDSATGAQHLRCFSATARPELDYGFRFRTGYTIEVPLVQFRGAGHNVIAFLRVTPDGRPPSYFAKEEGVPETPDLKADAELTGMVVIGEGGYGFEALVQDDAKRSCLTKWRIQARRSGSERDLKPGIPPGVGQELTGTAPFAAAERSGPRIDRLTILMHAAAYNPRAVEPEPETIRELTDSLASLLIQLPARSVRLVIFNLTQQVEVLRTDDFTSADLIQVAPALGRLKFAAVHVKTLQDRSHSDVFREIVDKELHQSNPATAVVFLGPRSPAASDFSYEPDPRRAAGIQWIYLQYEHMASLRFPALGRGGRAMEPGSAADPGPPPEVFNGPRGGRGRGDSPPAPVGAIPDTIEQLLRRVKGETLPVRSPHEFADAIRRILSEVNMVSGPAAVPR
jgi:hypothetical protein